MPKPIEITERERLVLIEACNYGLYYCPPEYRKQLQSLLAKAVAAKEEQDADTNN